MNQQLRAGQQQLKELQKNPSQAQKVGMYVHVCMCVVGMYVVHVCMCVVGMYVHVYMCVVVCMCMYACVWWYVCACVW